jgi:ribosome-associated translation inhibitor RaiA
MKFPTDVTFRGVDASASLHSFVLECTERLAHVFDRIERCDVTIELPHRHQQRGRAWQVRVLVAVPGKVLAATHEPGPDADESPYAAVSHAFRTVRRQLEDHAAILRDTRQRHAGG